MESRSNIVRSSYLNGFNCAQAILGAYAEDFGLDKGFAFKIACGFGGGNAEFCGVVCSMIVLAGLKHSKNGIDDMQIRYQKKSVMQNLFEKSKKIFTQSYSNDLESQRDTFNKIKIIKSKFFERYGSLKCKDILGCDITNPEGLRQAKENSLMSTKCINCLEYGCFIIEKELL